MSNPTSNFNWQMPTNTDLVTDLPADFEVFGQAVDTTLADLKGGTSGQILAKNSNTDMDFVWIANDQGDITGITATSPLTGGGTSGAVTVGIQSASTSQSGAVQLTDSTSSTSTSTAATPNSVKSAYDLANTANTTAGTANTTANAAIPKSTVTAKGSIVAATASSTPANLAVGNNGETLVADSSTSTGLRWNNNYGQNFVIGGNFDIWQRGTSFVSPSSLSYTADRWAVVYASTCTITQQTTGVPVGSTNCLRVAYTAANSIGQMATVLESGMVKMLAGKTVTLSVKVRRNASFSTNIDLVLSKNATANTLNGGSWTSIASTTIANASMPTGTTSADWYTATLTTTIPNDGTANGLRFLVSEQALGASGAYWEMAQAKLEIGSVATPMTLAGGTIQGELAACQRYYFRQTSNISAVFITPIYGSSYATTAADLAVSLPVTMRQYPSLFDYSNICVSDGTNNYSGGTWTVNNYGTPTLGTVRYTHGSSFPAAYRPLYISNATNASTYFGFSAEL